MRKSEAAASSSSSSSVSDANIKHTGSGSSILDRGTTATIKNATTTTTTTATSSVSSNGGGRRGINGTPAGNGSNDKNNSVQSAGREQRPLLDRQFDVVTAPLATFDTVDLSDEDEVTATSDTTTAPTTTTTGTTTKSPSFTGNNVICRESTPLTTFAAGSSAAGSHGIKTTRTVINVISCSNSINTSASSSSPTPATSNTNTTTISTLLQKLSPIVSIGKKSDAASSSTTLNPTPNQKKNQKKNSESSRGRNGASPPPPQEHKDATTTTSSAERTGKNFSPLHHHHHHPNDGSIRINQCLLPGDGVKDTDAIPDPTRATDPRVVHSSSSDDEENASPHDASSASLKNFKLDAISVESTLSNIGEGSAAKKAAAADTTAVDGATAGIALSSGVTHEFANFSSCDDLNSNNIGGSQSTVSEGGGLPTPAASVSSVPKPKELSAAVEKANLLDESSSSDSDLSPTEPANSGGAYTTLASGSTPNLLRKIGREPTSKIKESSAQTTDFNSPEVIPTSSKRKAYERRLQRLQVKTTPINRPRSATPLSVVTLDEYTNLSSPEISPNLEKLKIVLPADQFGRPIKSPRSKENAFDFNEDRLFRHTKEAIVLQSDGSIGQSPRRIFIPPTLSPSQSPCKAAAGSPVSKLVLVSRLPAGTSPLVKSAAPTVPPLPAPPPPLTSPPPPPNPTTTTTTATTFSFPSSTSSSASTWKGSDQQWEQFDESHPQGTKPPPQTICSVSKRSEPTAAIPDTFDKKTVPPRLGPPPPHGETGCPLPKGHREHEKRKTKVSTTVEEPTKPTLDQHHADSRRNNTSALHPSHKMLRSNPEEEEEEQILKVEIGSSDVGKAYNIELEVPTRERSDSSYSKSSS